MEEALLLHVGLDERNLLHVGDRVADYLPEFARNGKDGITIAQVLVDDAYWQFSIDPSVPLGRLQTARVSIPYPWVEGETHAIGLLSSCETSDTKSARSAESRRA